MIVSILKIQCDGCRTAYREALEVARTLPKGRDAERLRRDAAAEGWREHSSGDFCPSCVLTLLRGRRVPGRTS